MKSGKSFKMSRNQLKDEMVSWKGMECLKKQNIVICDQGKSDKAFKKSQNSAQM